MKPAPFRYLAPRTLDEALAHKAQHGDDAKFLAGGQSLVPTMNFRLAQPAVLIDINGLAALGGIREDTGAVGIGALTRYRALQASALIAAKLAPVNEALPHVAHPQIRNRGTIGGNLAHADPASELPAVMLALDARLRAQSARGERWIDARDFFVGTLSTALRDDEMLVEIRCPALPARSGTSFQEVARRRGDFALAGAVAVIALDANGICTHARLAFCGAGPTPMRGPQAERALIGQRVTEVRIRNAAALAEREVDPMGNMHASAAFQRHLAGVLARRVLEIAMTRVTR